MGRYPRGVEKDMEAIEHATAVLDQRLDVCMYVGTLLDNLGEVFEDYYVNGNAPSTIQAHKYWTQIEKAKKDISTTSKASYEAARALTAMRARLPGGQLPLMEEEGDEQDTD